MLKEEQEAKLESLHRQEVSERQENSYISRLGRTLEPVWTPLGFDWKAGVSLLTGVAAKKSWLARWPFLYQGEEVMEEDTGANATLERRLREHGFTPGYCHCICDLRVALFPLFCGLDCYR